MSSKHRLAVALMLGFAALGAMFAGISTYDYVVHLDRQVHAITCSYVPGLGAPDAAGSSGCFAAMMSPYAALARSMTWGGVPVALLALAVFVYLMAKIADVLLRRQIHWRVEMDYLLAAAALPLLMSILYFVIAVTRVGELCKVCVGIYVAAIGLFASALWACNLVRRLPPASNGEPAKAPRQLWRRYGLYFAEGVLFVAVAVTLYGVAKPSYAGQTRDCGRLLRQQDTYDTRITLHANPQGAPAIELLDPLCPACRALHQRLAASGALQKIHLEGALFPLDNECNWMLSQAVHPGACAVSEAILCADETASTVLEWSFAHQQQLRQEAFEGGAAAVRRRLAETFPTLADCMDKPQVKTRLNKALRWAVANSLPVLTPQLFVQGARLCDQDIDLGLEYSLAQLLETHGALGHGGARAP